MPKKITAEIIADFLVGEKITNVFDVTGGMIAYIEDAIARKPGIECTPCHHEQACGFSAEGYARITGNFGVAMATSGPGATNLITAIGSCYFDSTPALFITGQVNTENLRKDPRVRQLGFQETDIVSIIRPITKYARQVAKPEEVLYELEKAVFLAKTGRPGPVLLDIPINFQRTKVEGKKFLRFLGSKEHKARLKQNIRPLRKGVVDKLANLLAKCNSPVVLVGGGIRLSQTLSELKGFVENNNLPVVVSLMGIDAFPAGHQNFVGFIGSYGSRDANIVFSNADLVISLGSRLDVRQTGDAKSFSKNRFVAHVDVDLYSIGANVRANMAVHTGLKEFFAAVRKLKTAPKTHWLDFIKKIKTEFAYKSNLKTLDPNLLIKDISGCASNDAIITSDVGNHQMWLAQSWKTKGEQRVLFSGGMGSMGFGLPAAVGAFFAAPKRENILICGDGGFQMNLQELETIKRNKIPIKIFLLNNKSLGMVREFQDQYLNRLYQSTVIGYSVPSFKKIAKAYDITYIAITNSKNQKKQIRGALKKSGAVFVEVDLDILTPMQPKVMYGHALDDQYPFLPEARRAVLEKLKAEFKSAAGK